MRVENKGKIQFSLCVLGELCVEFSRKGAKNAKNFFIFLPEFLLL